MSRSRVARGSPWKELASEPVTMNRIPERSRCAITSANRSAKLTALRRAGPRQRTRVRGAARRMRRRARSAWRSGDECGFRPSPGPARRCSSDRRSRVAQRALSPGRRPSGDGTHRSMCHVAEAYAHSSAVREGAPECQANAGVTHRRCRTWLARPAGRSGASRRTPSIATRPIPGCASGRAPGRADFHRPPRRGRSAG